MESETVTETATAMEAAQAALRLARATLAEAEKFVATLEAERAALQVEDEAAQRVPLAFRPGTDPAAAAQVVLDRAAIDETSAIHRSGFRAANVSATLHRARSAGVHTDGCGRPSRAGSSVQLGGHQARSTRGSFTTSSPSF